MRTKEEANDYRYFPEPDLPPLVLARSWIEALRRTQAELPDARRRRFVSEYGLPEYDAALLTQSPALADFFEATAAAAGNPKAASNWIMGELTRKLNEQAAPASRTRALTAGSARGLDPSRGLGHYQRTGRQDGLREDVRDGTLRRRIVDAEQLARIDDEGEIARVVRDVLDAKPRAVAQYRAGKTADIRFPGRPGHQGHGGQGGPGTS